MFTLRNAAGIVLLLGIVLIGASEPPPASPADPDDPFLDTLQARTFDWFWDTTNPENGLTPDRWPRRTFSSVAAVGFALTAYGIGVERGYVSREDAVERVLTTLRFFRDAPQGPDQAGMTGYHGFFYHFLDMDTGVRFDQVELSTIDTALLMMGVLFCQSYFDDDTEAEAEIRALADELYREVEWDWAQPRAPMVSMGWDLDMGFLHVDYQGYNEAMFLYLLALGSPTYPISADAWDGYTSTYQWEDFYGYEHVNFTPLFGHQYSHAWVDFRGIQDAYMREKGIDYFENSRRATLSQREYAIDNPGAWKDYGPDIWGLTACDGPADIRREVDGEERQFRTYTARGASALHIVDDGTIAPTAVGGSLPFAPEVCLPALKAMRARYGDALFTEYGFLDSFNPTFMFEDVELRHGKVVPGVAWIDGDYLGIDQGPILLMAENYRTGLVWEVMKRNPYIVRGLQRAGFTGGWLSDQPALDTSNIPIREWAELQERDREGKTRIVVIGSSTAAGTGPQDKANAWVNRFRAYATAEDSTVQVLNLARGGYTTYQLLPTGSPSVEDRPETDERRNITRALARGADAVIINLPSNDVAQGFSVEEQLENFDTMVRTAEAEGIPVWIATTQPRNMDDTQRQDQVTVRDALYERYGDRVIDFWTDLALDDDSLDSAYDSGDGVHLNDEGHRILFERVRDAEVLESLLAEPVENR